MFFALPPTGAPIRFRDLAEALAGAPSWRDTRPMEAAFRQEAGTRHAVATGSGRMAVAMVLAALARDADPERNRVVIPGYTCYTVAAAIARAGLVIEPAEVDPDTLDFDYEKIEDRDWSKVLAVVPSSLLGFPADMKRLTDLCAARGVALIDDAAQCLGARFDGRPMGSFGVAGVFSLSRGKNVSAMGGGVLVTDSDELAETIRAQLEKIRFKGTAGTIARSTAYAALLRPSMYRAVTSLPLVTLGVSVFDPRFAFALPSGFQRKLAQVVLAQLPQLQAARVEAARHYRELLSGHGDIHLIAPHEEAEAVYLRFPFRVVSRARARILRRLSEERLGASTMYPEPVSKIPGISAHLAENVSDLPGANRLARSLVTLPTHPYVTAQHRERIAKILHTNLRDPATRR